MNTFVEMGVVVRVPSELHEEAQQFTRPIRLTISEIKFDGLQVVICVEEDAKTKRDS